MKYLKQIAVMALALLVSAGAIAQGQQYTPSGGTNYVRAVAAGDYATNSIAVAAVTNAVIANTQATPRWYSVQLINTGSVGAVIVFNPPATNSSFTASTPGVPIAANGGSVTFFNPMPHSIYSKTTNATASGFIVNALIAP